MATDFAADCESSLASGFLVRVDGPGWWDCRDNPLGGLAGEDGAENSESKPSLPGIVGGGGGDTLRGLAGAFPLFWDTVRAKDISKSLSTTYVPYSRPKLRVHCRSSNFEEPFEVVCRSQSLTIDVSLMHHKEDVPGRKLT